jgi:hypothetical protein
MLAVNRWLQDSVPPVSYKVQIAYVDTKEKHRRNKVAADDTYQYRYLNWMDMPPRFVNYSQANIYALKEYSPILYRLKGSNNDPNYFPFDHYKEVELPETTPKLENYLKFMKKSERGRVKP